MSEPAKRVALVTGGNKGIGLEIARQLGQQGITVVIGARDEARGNAAANQLCQEGLDAHAVQLDVTNAEEVAALPAFFQQRFGRLDILVNNAGVQEDPTGNATVALFRSTFEINVFAVFAVTEALLPLLKQSPAGRIVNHSSRLGSLTAMSNSPFLMPAYMSSKAALNMLTVLTARELKDTTVKVNSAHPGWVKTELGGEGAPLSIEEGARTAVELATLPSDGPTGGFFHKGQPLPW
ncbi:SDR family oxidoreductase [Hymenobacter jejuensis]|uniref:SDR family oxidoreductase n=1 Tax=Hymenobacter jejuensis TaxID=2502781 RepID=A0A5B8A0H2_9BACT|nr:SDR family oxidoreductase [Hymenobacter jejuensis]QDA60316.1 SDR family oxidoreductase [Hymenobacter jejuensis]